MSDQIEMLWKCSSCNAENKGRHKVCQNCSSPKEEHEAYYMPDDISINANVTDPEQLKHAKAGPDWECFYCRSNQRKLDGSCHQCGASQDDAEKDKVEAVAVSNIPVSKRKKINKTHLIIAGGSLLLILFCWLIFRTKHVHATVANVYWKHTVNVERYQIFNRDGFDPPSSAFNVQNDGRKIHHYNKVLDHHRTEHYTESVSCGENCYQKSCSTTPRSCSSNRNGYATCTGGNTVCTNRCSTKYCSVPRTRQVAVYRDDPVYRSYYRWNVWDWGLNRSVFESGNTTKTFWPSAEKIALNKRTSSGESEREKHEAQYKIIFKDSDDNYEYVPQTLMEFEKLQLGTNKDLEVSLGSIKIAEQQ